MIKHTPAVGDYCVMRSKLMQNLYETIDNVAKYDSTVLLLGESGVGKELLVKRIHDMSQRRQGPLVRINCGAIPENLMESEMFGYEKGAFTGAFNQGKIGLIPLANGGTLFLDEIAELVPSIQVKLLRVIQERHFYTIGGVKPVKVDVRFIAATNQALTNMVRAGKFREDLYYRLNVIPIKVPSLKERKEDVSQLIDFFLAKLNARYGMNKAMTPKAIAALTRYDWPGNIRELENTIERLLVTIPSDTITEQLIPVEIRNKVQELPPSSGTPLKDLLADYEYHLIQTALEKYHSLSRASKELGVDISTLSRKCKRYRIPV